MEPRYYVLHLNPEPWAIGSVSRGAKGARISPNPNLVAFQNAVREAMDGAEMLPEGWIKMTFFFFRQQAKYIDTNDKVRQRNQADATNMQKGLEDALQGILFENDKSVSDIRSVIVSQGPYVEPCIIIKAELAGKHTDEILSLPQEVLDEWVRSGSGPQEAEDKWNEAEELF